MKDKAKLCHLNVVRTFKNHAARRWAQGQGNLSTSAAGRRTRAHPPNVRFPGLALACAHAAAHPERQWSGGAATKRQDGAMGREPLHPMPLAPTWSSGRQLAGRRRVRPTRWTTPMWPRGTMGPPRRRSQTAPGRPTYGPHASSLHQATRRRGGRWHAWQAAQEGTWGTKAGPAAVQESLLSPTPRTTISISRHSATKYPDAQQQSV